MGLFVCSYSSLSNTSVTTMWRKKFLFCTPLETTWKAEEVMETVSSFTRKKGLSGRKSVGSAWMGLQRC